MMRCGWCINVLCIRQSRTRPTRTKATKAQTISIILMKTRGRHEKSAKPANPRASLRRWRRRSGGGVLRSRLARRPSPFAARSPRSNNPRAGARGVCFLTPGAGAEAGVSLGELPMDPAVGAGMPRGGGPPAGGTPGTGPPPGCPRLAPGCPSEGAGGCFGFCFRAARHRPPTPGGPPVHSPPSPAAPPHICIRLRSAPHEPARADR